MRHEVELYCPVDNIPEYIEGDLEGMDIGDSIHISAFKLPAGVKPVITTRNFTVATVAPPTTYVEEVVAAAAPAAGEVPAEGAVPAEGEAAAAAPGAAPGAAQVPLLLPVARRQLLLPARKPRRVLLPPRPLPRHRPKRHPEKK